MQSENRSCKAYEQKPNIPPDLYYGVIPINCGNCRQRSGERCKDEGYAKNRNNPELVESVGWCIWWRRVSMQEIRCTKCKKKLGDYDKAVSLSEGTETTMGLMASNGVQLIIKCPRCHVLNEVTI